jgi:glutathione S-transferase
MKLYYSPGACSLSPHIALAEAGLAHDLVKVDLATHRTADGTDYYAINGKGAVPVLELDDGQRLTEGPAIVQYIADRNPAAGLAPAAGTTDRYRLQEWLNFVTSELHKSFSPLFDGKVPAEYKAMVKQRLGARFDWLSAQLEGRDYLMGGRFTVADGYLFTVLSWCRWVGIDLAQWPVLAAYVARVAARPAVRQAMQAEGLLQ